MAGKRKTTPSKTGQDDKSKAAATVPTTIHLTHENLKLLKIGAIEEGPDMSGIVNQLIAQKYAGWHIRRGRGEATQNGPEQASSPPTVAIRGVTDRIDAIGRRATAPVDSALAEFSNNQS